MARNRPPPLRAVLFDLDGTLADTAPELAAATDALRRERGLPPLGIGALRPYVSGGARALLAAGLDLHPEHPDYAAARAALLDHYGELLGTYARLFDGMTELLGRLAQRGMVWGVVTNKPRAYAAPLLAYLGVTPDRDCLVTPDDVARAKPDPEGTLRACVLLGVAPAETLFVGDDERDVVAGHGAGTRTAAALWGYLAPGSRPVAWGAELLCPSPAALGTWIERAATHAVETD